MIISVLGVAAYGSSWLLHQLLICAGSGHPPSERLLEGCEVPNKVVCYLDRSTPIAVQESNRLISLSISSSVIGFGRWL